MSGCGDGVVRVYSMGSGQCLWRLTAAQGCVEQLAFAGNTIVAGYSDW